MNTREPSPPLPPLLRALERLEKTQPADRAFVDDREAVTWAEFAERVRDCAAALDAFELKPGERIGIHALNSIELAVTMLACWRAGLVTVLLSPASKGPELAQELSASGAVAYHGDDDLYPVGEPMLARCPSLRLALLLKRGTRTPETVVRFPSAVPPAPVRPEPPQDLAAILFSSGTTGVPKGVMQTHATFGAMGEAEWGLGITLRHVAFLVAPLGYITSLFVLAQCLTRGFTAILQRRFDPDLLLDAVARHRCTYVFVLSPSAAQLVLRAQQARPRDVSSCVCWPVGGDAAPASLLEAWPAYFGQELLHGYSLTEFFPALGNPPNRDRRGSIGIPVDRAEIRVARESGGECEPGEVGEIQLRGPYLFAGYWNDPKTTAAVMQDGWFRTGDLAHRDADGYFWFHGRLKLIITCDGEKISPQHVENALLEHADVVEAGVVGKPDAQHGEVPVAFVRLQPGSTVDATVLRDFVAARAEDCGVPAEIIFVEALPRGRTGKVDRRALREGLLTRVPAR
ncbi:MAG: long-chain fatty acid--CoA ligase [Verrucomicrobia bacterium]|nr:long-chain fatty acid--CoA ligase [Verrucomicrobiota bacterium]